MNYKWTTNRDFHWTNGELSVGKATTFVSDLDLINKSSNSRDTVRLHLGLSGDYRFYSPQFGRTWDLNGGHHNIMFSEGMDLEVQGKTTEIETFGVEFSKDIFLHLAQDESVFVQVFANKVLDGKPAILSEEWGTIDFGIQAVVHQILANPYKDALRDVYIYGKTLELLVLCIDNYRKRKKQPRNYINTKEDKAAIIDARAYILKHFKASPNLSKIARAVGINEFKLKYGFNELFGMPIFSFMINYRLDYAQKLLLKSNKSITCIADELGYSSPQHFSSQFKAKRGYSPSEFRKIKSNTFEKY